ncbi:antibiotic biosynthesis monooxygenase [Bradyrhizobium sp. 186]|uniref:antibiotic biosynthesis monooxygenase family protein n=1 Tax=Bradyrhizobium sp. 186 TaxID=2782654 RepID=UPI0020011A2D|nr:antibiotic biosynthesis monooxygenase [Bradyrhizobium sp. 186]UPK38540.1 antibiotic biosynthesis monooxygenase [Bradyrhizobium sp. 186]
MSSDAGPVLEIVHFRIDPRAVVPFAECAREAFGLLAGVEGCVSHDLKRSVEEPSLFALIIEWVLRVDLNRFREAAAHHPFQELLSRHLLQAEVYHFADASGSGQDVDWA